MSRDEIIANFQAITGIDDVNRSIECLEAHNWNLETAAAVALSQHDPYYQSSGGVSSNIGNSAAAGPTRRGAAGSARIQQDVAAPRDNVQNGAPPQQGIWGIISRLIGRDDGGRRRVNDTQRFIELFNLQHGTVHPTAHVGTFREAVDVAKRDFKFLVVYLHSPHHQDTMAFLRETLCTEVIQDFVDDNFVFWMGTLLFTEGYNTSSLLRASGFPYIAVITTIDNATTVCDAHEGMVSKEDLMNWLINIMETQGPQLVALRAESEERLMDRRIREEQDAAYQESLLQDQIREQQRQEEKERERREVGSIIYILHYCISLFGILCVHASRQSVLREQEPAAAPAAAREAEFST
jgi:FAS-associated factor 2